MLRIGKELGDDLSKSPEVIGHEGHALAYLEEDPVHPPGDQVLQDLDPEGLVLPPFQGPESRDLLMPFRVDPHGHEQGKVHGLALLGSGLGPVGIHKGAGTCWSWMRALAYRCFASRKQPAGPALRRGGQETPEPFASGPGGVPDGSTGRAVRLHLRTWRGGPWGP